jgi:hypothetical protein
MTADSILNCGSNPTTGIGGAILTSFHDSTNLTTAAKELYALTAGTASVVGVDNVAVDFTAADLTAMSNRIPFAVKRVNSTGTTVTRFLAIY